MCNEITALRILVERWDEEVRVRGNKTALTESDVRKLRWHILNVRKAEERLRVNIRTAQQFVEMVTIVKCL